jgi:hypothetical protein
MSRRCIYPADLLGDIRFNLKQSDRKAGYDSVMRTLLLPALAIIALAAASGQNTKPTNAKPTKDRKATRPIPAVTFEAHNEGMVEGDIYGQENLVSLTIDSQGVQYKSKTAEKPILIPWSQIAGWQANNFTSRSPSRTESGDFGIGIYQGARYFSFRTRSGPNYLEAVKALRAHIGLKERAGIG